MVEGSDQKPLLCIVLEGMDKQCTLSFNLEDLLGDTLITVSVINMTLRVSIELRITEPYHKRVTE